jgi:hypothetical protein
MKFSVLALFSLVFAFEAFAQARGPRYNNPGRSNGGGGRVVTTNNGGRNNGPVIINNGGRNSGRTVIVDNRYNQRRDRVIVSSRRYDRPVRFVGPRYNPYGINRSYRTVIRNYSWIPTNRLSCDSWNNTLNLNGYRIHDFMFNSECQQAIYDIQNYGDFCDDADLYDQNGQLTAQFSWESECRDALGWYY